MTENLKKVEQQSNLYKIQNALINMVSGGFAAMVGKTCSAPFERVKIIMQTESQNAQITERYKSIWDCFYRISKEEGILSFWKGNMANIIRYVPEQAIGFTFKEQFSNLFGLKKEKDQKGKLYALKYFLSGGCAGALANTIVYPLDFSRTRLAVDMGKSSEQRQFKGIFHCLKVTVKNDGIKGIYRGVFPNMVCIFIYRGVYFGLFDYTKNIKQIKDFQNKNFFCKLLVAQLVTITAASFVYPFDTVKRKMMMQSNSKTIKYNGAFDCLQQIIQKEGFQAVFRGYLSNCLRSVSGAVSLTLFDTIQNFRQKKSE
ncbi:Mitochondrial carrier domain [Pseudocohnilembus persalinus]|uniref:ADP/ATP translocase n=1 Tax=Pseudocohnilembus persalinus TaxID=266149 RepID=A0A0V0R0C3_PSEPJ|nr:Mitochondrial carrier domain [Pseudocohnilembus persalinus]|eukprot:KRX07964.1 Mitochondrial carrier domain [Pseudocohnilembus persalinus]